MCRRFMTVTDHAGFEAAGPDVGLTQGDEPMVTRTIEASLTEVTAAARTDVPQFGVLALGVETLSQKGVTYDGNR